VQRAAPVRHYAAPVRVQRAAPVRHYAAPVRVQRAAPVRHYAAPVRVQRAAPVRHYAAPVRVQRAAPVRHYAAPVRVQRAAPVRHYAAPVRIQQRRETAPFVQHVAPERHVHAIRGTQTAPFAQYVRTAPRQRTRIVTRTVATSPLVRAPYVARTRTIPVVYHPRYIAGRIASVRRNEVVIDPPAGSPVIVRDVVINSGVPAVPVGSVVTLPVTYSNGYYTYAPPVYSAYGGTYGNAYDYGYAPQYQYAYAPPMYCNGDSSSALYAALIPAVLGMLSGNGNSLNSNDLASIALSAATGANGCAAYPPAYDGSGYTAPLDYGAPISYAAPVPVRYAVTQAAPIVSVTPQYTTPYDTCLAGDEDGDESCAPVTGYNYANYSAYGPYTPQQVQGVVIGRSGDTLMLLGANGTPTFVYAAPALQSGYTVNGPIQAGQIVDAYGYYNGSTFVATALL
jgi:hypothetical protein